MIDYGEEGDLTNIADKFGQWVILKLNLVHLVLKNIFTDPSAAFRTPLMLAVLGGHTDCAHFLLEKGALPDAKDKRGSTALHRGVG